MQFFAPINIKPVQPSITYNDRILLTGSCFTEHIGNHLMDAKFNVLQNPNGILFDTLSVCRSLVSYIENKQYTADDLFYLNECWHNWQYHSRFSNIDQQECLRNINASQNATHTFLANASWLIVTLGSSFCYKLAETGMPVANCHKAPAKQFIKYLCTIDESVAALEETLEQLFQLNPKLNIIFTISPVRHLRDGVVDNNRSKARLIEAVHHTVNKFEKAHYFPAYELVIDVLRDYRFYDIDLTHPNYAATSFVLEKFAETCFDAPTVSLMEEIRKIVIGSNHKAFNPSSQQHKQFLQTHFEKTTALQQQYPQLDFSKELQYFSQTK